MNTKTRPSEWNRLRTLINARQTKEIVNIRGHPSFFDTTQRGSYFVVALHPIDNAGHHGFSQLVGPCLMAELAQKQLSWVTAYLQQADPRSAFYKLRVMRLPKWTGQVAPLRAMPQLSMPYHLMAFDVLGNWGHRLVGGTVCHGYAVLGKAHASWRHVVVVCGEDGEKLALTQLRRIAGRHHIALKANLIGTASPHAIRIDRPAKAVYPT